MLTMPRIATSPSPESEPAALAPDAPGWRDVDWESRRRTIDLGGDHLHYVDLGGSGTPLLFIHGLGGNWTAWLENLPAFTAQHRVLAIDLPGFGGSPVPAAGISIVGYADIVTRFCAALELASVTIFGSSLGGWVAAELAQRRPAWLSALVLVDAAGIFPTRAERWKALSLMEGAAIMAPLAPRFRRSIASRRKLRAMSLRYTIDSPADLAADLVYMALPAAPDPGFRLALTACRRSWSTAWGERLREITCPTMVVWGERDSLLPLRHGREFARLIPNAEFHAIAAAGHVPMIERPAEFNRLGQEFLDRLGQAHTSPPGADPTLGESPSDA
jgi:pimeloyl-ACP methyl ester carboxylesterase